MSWKAGRLKSTRYATEKLLDHLRLPYSVYRRTGCFSIELGESQALQYLCSTGSWGWYKEGGGVPESHGKQTTLKRFYENVLLPYVDDPVSWKELRKVINNEM